MYRETEPTIVTETPAKVGKWHALADAIRQGCLLVPRQCRGHLREYYREQVVAACALGAAELVGSSCSGPGFSEVRCPICKRCPLGYRLASPVIPHLNDDHRWKRERIADWLDTLS